MRDTEFKARAKVVRQMSRDGLEEKDIATGKTENISSRDVDENFAKRERELEFRLEEHERKLEARWEIPHQRRATPAGRSRLKYRSHESGDDTGHGRLHFTAKEDAEEQPAPEDAQTDNDNAGGASALNDEMPDETDNPMASRMPGWTLYRPKVWNQTLIWKSGKWATGKAVKEGTRWLHKKISEVENDNSGVQAAHLQERFVEKGVGLSYRGGRALVRFARGHPKRKLEKLTRSANIAHIKLEKAQLQLTRFENRNSRLTKIVPGTKEWQKKRLQRKYAQRLRKSEKASGKAAKVGEKAAATAARETSQWIARVIRKVIEFISATVSWVFLALGALGTALLLLLLAIALAALISNIFIISTSYLAEDTDIHDSSVLVTKLEAELDLKIAELPSLPEWSYIDEFRYDLDPIGHNPFVLMAWLTAKFDDFKIIDVEGFLNELHNARYELQTEVEIEVRERTYIDNDGEEQTEEYNYYILNVTLRSKTIEEIIGPEMAMDESGDLRDRFDVLMETKGNHQSVANPFDFDWTGGYSSIYGYRLDPLGSGTLQLHRGLDIPMPTGTPIRAGLTGAVIETGYNDTFGNFIVLEDKKGENQVKYAHCDRLNLSSGQLVKAGETIIATVGNTGGSTGSHVHIEVKNNGNYLNPIYMVEWEVAKPKEKSA